MIRKLLTYFIIISLALLKLYFITVFDETEYEFDSLVASMRVQSGELPIKDFQTAISPGYLYFKSASMDLFGTLLINQRFAEYFIYIYVVLFLYYFSTKIYDNKYFSILVYLISSLWLIAIPLWNTPVLTSLALIITGVYFLYRYFLTQNKKNLLVAGAILSILFFVVSEFALYLLGAEFWAIFFFRLAHLKKSNLKLIKKVKISLLETLPFIFGILLVFIPILYILLSHISFEEYIHQSILYPIIHHGKHFAIEFPNLSMLFGDWRERYKVFDKTDKIQILFSSFYFLMPMISVLLTAFSLYYRTKFKKMAVLESRFWYVMMMLNLVGNLFGFMVIRSDLFHMIPAFLPTIILTFWLIESRTFNFRLFLVPSISIFILIIPILIIYGKIDYMQSAETIKQGNLKGMKCEIRQTKMLNEIYKYHKITNMSSSKVIIMGTNYIDNEINVEYTNEWNFLYYHLSYKPQIYHHEINPFYTSGETKELDFIESMYDCEYIILFDNEKNKFTQLKAGIISEYIKQNYSLDRTYLNSFYNADKLRILVTK